MIAYANFYRPNFSYILYSERLRHSLAEGNSFLSRTREKCFCLLGNFFARGRKRQSYHQAVRVGNGSWRKQISPLGFLGLMVPMAVFVSLSLHSVPLALSHTRTLFLFNILSLSPCAITSLFLLMVRTSFSLFLSTFFSLYVAVFPHSSSLVPGSLSKAFFPCWTKALPSFLGKRLIQHQNLKHVNSPFLTRSCLRRSPLPFNMRYGRYSLNAVVVCPYLEEK